MPEFWQDLPPFVQPLLIFGAAMLFMFAVSLANRNNPKNWQNRLKQYDAYEERIKKLETRVALLNRKLKHQAIKYERTLQSRDDQ